MLKLLNKLFSYNERQIKKARKIVEKINALEPEVAKLTDEELAKSTEYFRQQLGIDASLNRINPDLHLHSVSKEERRKELLKERQQLLNILPEVFARVREAAKRVAKHRHFDVQLIGGILLAENKVIEVFTGEGKTNVALLPAYLYGLTGRGVHIHTVNDYLAKRDAEWAGHVLMALGMSVAVVTPQGAYKVVDDETALQAKGDIIKKELEQKDLSNMSTLRGTNLVEVSKKEAYLSDIVYGQASEFGFDYLRDNMASSLEERVQRSRYFAIVDEADSILIDEARTPLIISMPDQQSSEIYKRFASIAKQLKKDEDYTVDEKTKSVVLTEAGVAKVEKMLNTSNIWANNLYIRHINNALKAQALFTKDKDYIVKNGEVLIVDEFTGRVQPGRRYSEGLHQAIEAKEGVEIKQESKTLATISYQNFFRLYDFLSGMTGTAMTEAEEFHKIYNIDVVQVPTYKPIIRKDHPDVIYKTKQAKYKAIVDEIKKVHATGRPILVGTTSIQVSELLSDLLKKEGIPHEVLNAKHHEKEARIVAKAGKKGAVTIATNMAGRGTDIKISDEVKKLGGLYILGTERHEARRIDNQLRGRSGRLGDPGASRFFLSLEDTLLRVFGGDMLKNLYSKTSLPEDVPLESRLLSSAIERAQKKIESMHFDIRRRLVEYDDVLNNQRDIVYDLRRIVLVLLGKEEKDATKYLPKSKKDPFELSKQETHTVVAALKAYTLKSPYSFGLDKSLWIKNIMTPLRFWLLKQIIERVDFLIAQINTKNSENIDTLSSSVSNNNTDFKFVLEYIDAMFPDKVFNDIVKKLGFEVNEFFDRVAKGEIWLLHKVIIIAYSLQLGLMHSIENVKRYIRFMVLQTIDFLWMEHIDTMADLREGIGLRGYAQRDPLVEYKREGRRLFEQFFATIKDMIAKRAFRIGVLKQENMETAYKRLQYEHSPVATVRDLLQGNVEVSAKQETTKRNKVTTHNKPLKLKKAPKRNEPCPCGSGKKYKNCCWPKYG